MREFLTLQVSVSESHRCLRTSQFQFFSFLHGMSRNLPFDKRSFDKRFFDKPSTEHDVEMQIRDQGGEMSKSQ